MKITIPALAFFCLCSFSLFAQSPYTIKGTVVDTSMNKKMENATINILNAKDSTLYKFGRVKPDGSFSISNMKAGKFLLLVTYPTYADYAAPFALDAQTPLKDFKQINLITKAMLLAEVVIRGKTGITVKGDTTEFGQGSFVVQPNAKVEDLLKQLPGIEVDENGKITAYGKPVQKMLLDGEEFFGDDPTLITRNIRGDMVDKFQLYEKKSDQATFTGVDDGKRTTTINVVLKEDKRKGFFGKADAGGTANNLYESQAAVNVFNDKMKIAAFGNTGTTGRPGLNLTDGARFGTGSALMIEGGVASIGSFDELEGFGQYSGSGLPETTTSGIFFTDKWNKNKGTMNASYKIGDRTNETGSTSISQILQPIVTTQRSQTSSNNYLSRQKMNLSYELRPAISSLLKITADATVRNTDDNRTSNSSSTREDNTLQNEQIQATSSRGNDKNLNTSFLWNKSFKKAGRSFSLNVQQTYTEGTKTDLKNTSSNLYSTNTVEHVDQLTRNSNRAFGVTTNINWNEPLSKKLTMTMNYMLNISNSTNNSQFYDKSSSGEYDSLNTVYSNNFDYQQTTNQGRMTMIYRKGQDLNLNLGMGISNVNYNQLDKITDTEYDRDFVNLMPQLTLGYTPAPNKRINITYSGSTVQPSINQLQPIKNNNNPLYIVVGNPDLKQYFRNSLNFSYSSSKPLLFKSMSVSGSISLSTNSTGYNTNTDDDGRSISQPININKHPLTYSLSTFSSARLKKPKISLSYNAGFNGNTNYSLQNNILSTDNNYGFNGGMSTSKSVAQKYTFGISISSSYRVQYRSITNVNNINWGLSPTGSFTLFLPGKTELSSTGRLTYTLKASNAFEGKQNPVIVSSTITKRFLKGDNLRLSLRCNDILNQNNNFNNSPTGQSTSLALKRFFLGSLSWDFSKFGKSKASQTAPAPSAAPRPAPGMPPGARPVQQTPQRPVSPAPAPQQAPSSQP